MYRGNSTVRGHGGITEASITGWMDVAENLNKKIMEIEGYTRAGLIKTAKFIKREMESKYPVTPRDTGNLRASFSVKDIHGGPLKNKDTGRTGKRFSQYGIQFGYYANYALWVHEMVDADFKSPRWRISPVGTKKRWYIPTPNAGAKFFESAINRNLDDILSIIQEAIKTKSSSEQ